MSSVVASLRPWLLLLLAHSCIRMAASWWLYTLPEGACSTFTTCQECVVEYAYTSDGAGRRPCTWCPAKGTCEMMNHYTGRCSEGNTYRDTCPIRSYDMPRCVYFQYSYWFSYSAAPQKISECGEDYAYDFASQKTNNSKCPECYQTLR